MMFIGRNTSVRVPKVYALYADPIDNKKYLVMERLQGDTLETLWPGLNFLQKETIMSKIGKDLKEIRSLPSPGYFGSLGRRPVLDNLFWTGSGSASLSLDGPFATEEDLNNALVEICLSHDYPPRRKAEYYRTAFRTVLKDHPPTFTHGDLQRKNIIVRPRPQETGGKVLEDWDVVIIDWESAGWLPSYWEYSRAIFANGQWKDDWGDWIGKVLQPYFNEWAWLTMLIHDIWC